MPTQDKNSSHMRSAGQNSSLADKLMKAQLLTNTSTHKLTNPPTHNLINLQIHQLTNSSTHKLTTPQTHNLINS